MAKESMKAREVKRAKLVAKYAEKRKALKEAGDWAGNSCRQTARQVHPHQGQQRHKAVPVARAAVDA